MFGGYGIYADGIMFALSTGDALYLKSDERTRPDFEAEDCEPFTYEARGRRTVMSYWRAPDRLLDDAEEMALWARKALEAARRAAEAKLRKKKG